MKMKVENKRKGYRDKDLKRQENARKAAKVAKKLFIQKRSLKDTFF